MTKDWRTAYTIHELEELVQRQEAEETAARRKRRLAEYDPHWLLIRLDGWYEVDLEEMTGPAAFMDWLLHLREKNWFTPQMTADFLAELDVACGDRRVDPRSGKWNWGKCPARVERPRT